MDTFGAPDFESPSNLTPRAQRVLALARKEADRFHHHFVGSEHLLLGILVLEQGTAVNVLKKLGLKLEVLRGEIERLAPTGEQSSAFSRSPYTPRLKRILGLAAREARAMNHSYVGTEHILLGLLHEGEGIAARVLKNLKINVEETRLAVLRELDFGFMKAAERAKDLDDLTNSFLEQAQPPTIETTRRYDIYCREGSQKVTVYRGALFKPGCRLMAAGLPDLGMEFLELQLANGRSVFVPPQSVIKFCDAGAEIDG